MIQLGVDTDNYDEAVSVARYKHLYDTYGMRFCIVGCQVGVDGRNFTQVQIDNARAAGLIVPFSYEFLYWDSEDMMRIQRAADRGLPVAIDIEYGNGMGSYERTVQRMHEAKDLLVSQGRFWGWYSSPNEWLRLTNTTMDFAGDLGWAATYPYKNLPPVGYVPDWADYPYFGGTLPAVWQYADKCYDEPGFDMNAMEVEDVKDGWVKEGLRWLFYNNGVCTEVRGSLDGRYPGRIGKLFGDKWFWLRKDEHDHAFWSEEEGD